MVYVELLRAINKFSIAKIDRKDWVKYKTIPNWHGRVIGEILVTEPTKAFIDTVEKYVNAYIFNKKAPPTQIASAIMNIADDVLSNREPVVRAGDYIAIQNFIREKLPK